MRENDYSKNRETEALLRNRGWSMHSSDHDNAANQDKEDHDDSSGEEPLVELDKNDDDDDIESCFMATSSDDESSVKIVKNDELELNQRKAQLSKWSLQFLDPQRASQRKTIIEPPQILPLNDVYLKEFGKREREDDEAYGREVDIDRSTLDDNIYNIDDDGDVAVINKKSKKGGEGCKVKIINLKFTTTDDVIRKECSKFGNILEARIIMDKDNPDRSAGRAFVIFENSTAALSCAQELNEKTASDGRVWRVVIAAAHPHISGKDGFQKKSLLTQHWQQKSENAVDISIKCRRCQQVGHMEVSCRNAEGPKPCYICARIGEHDSRECPMTCVCFSCGVPGHASRNCSEPRVGYGTRKPRVVCGICFSSTHHRWKCPAQAEWEIRKQDAYCFVCGEMQHFSCKRANLHQPSSFMRELSCFNCGQQGHHGGNCVRPKVEACARNNQIAFAEIERAESWVDDMEKLRKHPSDARGRHPVRGDDNSRRSNNYHQSSRERPTSLPPQRRY